MSITIFYDGKCGLCSKEIGYYKQLDYQQRFRWLDITEHSDDLRKIGISQQQVLMSLHGLDQQGRLSVGIDTFILIWQEFPKWRLASYFIKLPIAYHFARRLYKCFTLWRFHQLKHCQTTQTLQ